MFVQWKKLSPMTLLRVPGTGATGTKNGRDALGKTLINASDDAID